VTEIQKCKILVVDDEAAHRTLTVRALRKIPLATELYQASSIAEAQEVVTDFAPFDLFVIDLRLASESGLDLLRALKSNPLYQTTPALILSTSMLEAEREQSLSAGALAFVNKSPDLAQFQADLEAAVAKCFQ